jgi:hypothetical protein
MHMMPSALVASAMQPWDVAFFQSRLTHVRLWCIVLQQQVIISFDDREDA